MAKSLSLKRNRLAGRRNPGGCFLSNGPSQDREAPAFPPAPSGKCGAGALARVLFPSPPQPGHALRPQRSETHCHYRLPDRPVVRMIRCASMRQFWEGPATPLKTLAPLVSRQGYSTTNDYFSAISIAASAMGAIILYPAALGCNPSSANSFFM
jgi:hypothetical protein